MPNDQPVKFGKHEIQDILVRGSIFLTFYEIINHVADKNKGNSQEGFASARSYMIGEDRRRICFDNCEQRGPWGDSEMAKAHTGHPDQTIQTLHGRYQTQKWSCGHSPLPQLREHEGVLRTGASRIPL